MPPSFVKSGRPDSKLSRRSPLALAFIATLLVVFCSIPAAGFFQPPTGSLPVVPSGSIVVEANLPNAHVGISYKAQASAQGGREPYQYAGFGLPPGLTISLLNGEIVGTPTMVGTYEVLILVTDSSSFGLKLFQLAVRNITSMPTVTISPAAVSLRPNGTQQFKVAVAGTRDTRVNWSASAGSISSSGLLTAPAGSSNQTVLVTATSAVGGKNAQAVVTVTQPVSPAPLPRGGYKLSLYGPHTLYPGYDSYVQLIVSYTGKIGHVFFADVNSPGGVTASVICTYAPCWRSAKDARMFQWNLSQKQVAVLVHFQAATDLAPGDYQATVTTEVAGATQSIEVPLKVLPVSIIAPSHPAFPPPIPGLVTWQKEMLKLASKWCEPKKLYSFGYEDDVWYYDGARVYFQIADYTHDNSWNGCALNLAKQYAAYVISNKGNIPGWRVFPQGLRMAYERTGIKEYRQAAILLAQDSAYAAKGGDINDSRIRETAYVLQSYIQAEKLGEGRSANLIKSADFLLGMFEVIFDQHAYAIHQAFFDGLAAAALIDYYQLTGDPRVPPAIKKMLDWVWNTAWNQTSYCLVWGVVDGPNANPACQTALNNLVDPAFAWYYNLTGNADPTYLKAGDEMFSHALDTDISYSGKIFSQNYRWSFDYLYWRGNR